MKPATATMRVNVYAEALRWVNDDEYGPRVYLHNKQVKDERGKDLPFIHRAISILIGERVIHTGKKKPDDDTAAVTFWYADENERQMLVNIFETALAELNKPEAKP